MSISNLFDVPNDYNLFADTLNITNQYNRSDTSLIVNGKTILNGEVIFSLTSNSSNESTGSLVVSGGAGIEKDLYVGGTLTANNIIYKSTEIITNTEESTSTSTGALQVAGGAGIAKNCHVGGNNITRGNSTTYGNETVIGSIFVGGNINGNLKTTTTDSNSTSTGSLIVSGGVGIAKSLFCNSINATTLNLSSVTPSTDITTGALIITGGCGIGNNLNVGGNTTFGGLTKSRTLRITSTNNSTDTFSGSVIISGGASIAGDLHVGGAVIESNPRSMYVPSSDWYLLYNMTTSQNLNILARSITNQITQLLINSTNISTNADNFINTQMPRFLVYKTGSIYNVFIQTSSNTNLNVLTNDTPLIMTNYGSDTYPNGYIDNYLFDTNTNSGFSSSDVFYLYNTSEANSTSTGTLIVDGGIACGSGIYVGGGIQGGITTSSTGGYSKVFTDDNGNLNLQSSSSGIIITGSNSQFKVQRYDDLNVNKLTNAPIFCYGAISSLKKMGSVEGFFVNPNIWGTTTSTNANYGGMSMSAGTGNLELSSISSGVNIRSPPKYTFYVAGNQYGLADYANCTISTNNISVNSGDLSISNGYIMLNNGGTTRTGLKYSTGTGVDAGQVGSMSCYFKTTANYTNPPPNGVTIMELYGNSANKSNMIQLYHHTSGYLKLQCYDDYGNQLFDTQLITFTPIVDQAYFMSVDWDFTTGSTKVFLDGTQIGSTFTNIAVRDFGIYYIVDCPSSASFGVSFIQIYPTKQYNSTYTRPINTNYNLVSFPSSGGVQIFNDVTDQTSGLITCGLDGSLNWNGTGLPGQFIPTQIIQITNSTSSTSITTGALQVVGGISTQENLNIGGSIASSNITSGSLQVVGGVGVGASSHFGDTVTIHNNSTTSLLTQLNTDVSGIFNVNINSAVKVNTAITYDWYGAFLTSPNADFSIANTSLIATTTGTVSISNGKLNIAPSSSCYWTATSGGNTIDGITDGCCNFKFTPAYAGYPTATVTMFQLVNSTGNFNKLQMYHMSSGSLKVGMYDSAGTVIFDTNLLSTWLNGASAGIEYEMELNWSSTAVRLFINGTQLGATIVPTSTRSGTCTRINTMCGASASGFAIRQLQIYKTVQHTSNYTALQPIGGNLLSLTDKGLTIPITTISTSNLTGSLIVAGGVGIGGTLCANRLPITLWYMGPISNNSNTDAYFSLNPDTGSSGSRTVSDSVLFNVAYPVVHAYGMGQFGNLNAEVCTLKLSMVIDSTTYIFFENPITASDAIDATNSQMDIYYKIVPITGSTFDVYIVGTTTFSDTGAGGINAFNTKQRPIYYIANNGGSHFTRGSTYSFDGQYKYETASTSNYATIVIARHDLLNVY